MAEPLHLFTAGEIAAAVDGDLTGSPETQFSAIVTDTRKIVPDCLFIALKGETFDGADYAKQAVEKGAAGVLVRKDCPAEKTAGLAVVIKAADTLAAYQAIARAYRRYFAGPVLAVTGSNGKTSTKDLTACVLDSALNTLKTQANFNNEIGLPLTLLQLDMDHDAAVVEMGMRGLGQIAQLAAVAEPVMGIVTNVGETHMELLGSLENIAQAKGELIEALPENGIAVLNNDNQFVAAMAGKARPGVRVITYGIQQAATVRALPGTIKSEGFLTRFTVKFAGDETDYPVELPLAGRHNIYNALAALGAGYALRLDPGEMIEALKNFQGSAQRFECLEKNVDSVGKLKIINDAYNASPMSMEAALETMAEIAGDSRRIAVLGDMLELGNIAVTAHEKVGRQAAKTGIDFLVTRGEMSRHIARGAIEAGLAPEKVFQAADHQAAAQKLREFCRAGDTLLFKGSHGMQMDKIIDML